MNVLYSTTVTATGGRNGSVASSDGKFSADLVVPIELGGSGGDGANPEQLFAAGYAACFLSTIKLLAGHDGADITDDATVTATVGLGPIGDGKAFGFEIALEVELPGVEESIARQITDLAHQTCPYSNVTRGNAAVTITLA